MEFKVEKVVFLSKLQSNLQLTMELVNIISYIKFHRKAFWGGLESDQTDYGVIAMENAQGGVVIESVEALANYRCSIIEMFHITVDQNLLGLSGMNVGDITEIHSHQQALRQCKDFLSEFFWTRPLIEEDDTAESARRLSEGKLPKTAGVIANKACAKLYGLEILQESIHDLKHNLTLFLGVKKL